MQNFSKIVPIGDNAVYFYLPEPVQDYYPLLLKELAGYAKKLGACDVIPAYHSLLVTFSDNNDEKEPSHHQFQQTVIKKLTDFLPQAKQNALNSNEQKIITIPVCYDKEFAPDLERIAIMHNISTQAVIEQHKNTLYDVCCLGFIPGFAFLGYVDDSIATPRLDNPRPFVAGGSVGIAGKQTGVYPVDSAGGWNIIGRTPKTLYAPDKQIISCFNIGDKVRFYEISKDEFDDYKE